MRCRVAQQSEWVAGGLAGELIDTYQITEVTGSGVIVTTDRLISHRTKLSKVWRCVTVISGTCGPPGSLDIKHGYGYHTIPASPFLLEPTNHSGAGRNTFLT